MSCLKRARRALTAALVAFCLPMAANAQATKTAADIVPADCDFFSTSLMLKEQYEGIANSNAIKKIMNLPYVQMGMAQAKSQPQYAMAMQVMEDPEVKEVLALLKDCFSTESFSYGEKGWPALYQVFTDYQQANMMSAITGAMSGKQPSPLPAIIGALTKQKDFKFPAMVFGFKVADHAKATKVLARLKELASGHKLPGKLSNTTINNEKFLSYVVTGKDIPLSKEQFVEELGKQDVSQYDAEKLHDWLMERTFEVAIGKAADYLVLSVGSDSKHVERIGKGPSLGESDNLKPIRKHLAKGNLLSLGYSSLAVASIGSSSMKDSLGQLETLAAPFKGFLPPGLADRILGDLRDVASDIDSVATKPSESVSVSLYNNGPESFGYTRTVSLGVDYSRPLGILNHAGQSPMLAVAGSSKSSIGSYKTAVKYAKKAWGYWRDYGIPRLQDDQKTKYKQAEKEILPFIAKIDSALVNKLLPATDAGQSIFVIDSKLRIKSLGPDVHFNKPMPMLELALGTTLNDGKQFKEGIAEVAAAVEDLIPKLAALDPNAPDQAKNFKIPRPNVKSLAGGDMYFYPMPPIVDPAVLPHAYVSDKLLILGVSPTMTERMVKEASTLPGEVINLSEPSGMGVAMDMKDFWAGVREWVGFAAEQPGSPIAPKNAEGVLNRQHLEAGLDVLGVFKKASARTYREGDYTVTHSWSHFEDVPN